MRLFVAGAFAAVVVAAMVSATLLVADVVQFGDGSASSESTEHAEPAFHEVLDKYQEPAGTQTNYAVIFWVGGVKGQWSQVSIKMPDCYRLAIVGNRLPAICN